MRAAFASSVTLQWRPTPHALSLGQKRGFLAMRPSVLRRCCPLATNPIFRPNIRMTIDAPETSDSSSLSSGVWSVRKIAIGAVYAAFLAYVALGPGDWREAGVLVDVLNFNFDNINNIYCGILGLSFIQSVSYTQLLQPGLCLQSFSIPTPLFPLLSILGFPVLAPYLVLRKYVPRVTTSTNSSMLTATSVVAALCTMAALACYGKAFSVLAPGAQMRDVLVYAAGIDFGRAMNTDFWFRATAANSIALALCMVDPIAEDMQRRGWSFRGKDALEAFVTLASIVVVPGFGPASYLVFRPDVRPFDSAKDVSENER